MLFFNCSQSLRFVAAQEETVDQLECALDF